MSLSQTEGSHASLRGRKLECRKSPGRSLCRELSLTTEPFPLADNQSEYSVGSEEEDEDFDERPEGSISFPFYHISFPFHFALSFQPTVFMQIILLFLWKK